MDENRRKELECALYASLGVSLSVYPYLAPLPNLFLSLMAGTYWIIVRGQFGIFRKYAATLRSANYVLFWVLAGMGSGPMLLSIRNGRRVGVASVLLPFLVAGVSGMTGQIRDLLQPWPEEMAAFDMDAKALEHQLCLAYFQTSGGMVPTVFAGVLIFSLWMQWEWAKSWNPQYLPVHDTILALYGVGIYILGIVQPGLTRSKLIRREIMIHRASQTAQNTLDPLTATTIPTSPTTALPKVFDNAAAADILVRPPSNANTVRPPFACASPAPSINDALDQLTQATTNEVHGSTQPEPRSGVEADALESTPDGQRPGENALEFPYDEAAEKAADKVYTDPAKSAVAKPREGTPNSPRPKREPGPPTGGDSG